MRANGSPRRERFLLATALIALFGFGTMPCAAQPASIPLHPDLHGGWMKVKGPAEGENTPPPLTPQGQAVYEKNKAGIAASDPNIDVSLRCVPTGFPRTALNGFPIYITQDDTLVAILGEASQNLPQMIWLNTPHRQLWPSYMGDSVGRWDGDTFIVDTTSIKTATFFNSNGLPHSDVLHVIERFQLINGGKQLENQMTFEDPKVLTAPWKVRVVYNREDKERPIENVCDTSRLAP